MKTNPALAAAIETFRPELETLYANQARRIAERILEEFGPTLRGVYNSRDARTFQAWVYPILSAESFFRQFIDDAKLARFATQQADACITSWSDKISNKLGDLEDANINRLNGYTYSISGHRGGRAVTIEQQLIVKSSSKGTVFNQFPARIYVDGKFTPEKKYHEMFV